MADENAKNWEEMSDEDFMKAEGPGEELDLADAFVEDPSMTMEDTLDLDDGEPLSKGPDSEETSKPTQTTKPTESADSTEAEEPAGEGEAESQTGDAGETESQAQGGEKPASTPASNPASTTEAEAETKPEAKAQGEAQSENEQGEQGEEKAEKPDYEALYKQIMTPFKANGRTFEPQSPEEMVRLAQQGANYVKKMTALKPNLKMMRMLQNHDLLNEDKLSHLIDIASGQPEAIQKLLKDKKIDPMSIDTDQESTYRPGDHKVTDEQYAFQSTLDDVLASPNGTETVRTINDSWDDQSKKQVLEEPAVLTIIHTHRQNGIYGKITDEMERQKLLGTLPDTVPFLTAYKTIGDQLDAQGRLGPQPAPNQGQGTPAPTGQAPATHTRQPIATSQTKRPTATNGDRAKAASPVRTTPGGQKRQFDPFSMTDEEVMKATSPRI